METQKIKTCVAYGCLAVIIVTTSGPICKKCFKELYKISDLPAYVSENISNSSSAMAFDISRSAMASPISVNIEYFDEV